MTPSLEATSGGPGLWPVIVLAAAAVLVTWGVAAVLRFILGPGAGWAVAAGWGLAVAVTGVVACSSLRADIAERAREEGLDPVELDRASGASRVILAAGVVSGAPPVVAAAAALALRRRRGRRPPEA